MCGSVIHVWFKSRLVLQFWFSVAQSKEKQWKDEVANIEIKIWSMPYWKTSERSDSKLNTGSCNSITQSVLLAPWITDRRSTLQVMEPD